MDDYLTTENGKNLTTETDVPLIVNRTPHAHLLAENRKRLITQSGLRLLVERDLRVSAEFGEVVVELQDDGTLTVTWDGEFHNVAEFEVQHSIDGTRATWETVGIVNGSERSLNFPADVLGETRVIALDTSGGSLGASSAAADDEKNEEPCPGYAIIDLGVVPPVTAHQRGVNDSGQVLFGNRFWSQGQWMTIGLTVDAGPLQDGRVYCSRGEEWEYDPLWEIEGWIPGEAWQSIMYVWQSGGASETGINARRLSFTYKEPKYFESVLKINSLPSSVKNRLMGIYDEVAPEAFIVENALLDKVNDAGVHSYSGGLMAGDFRFILPHENQVSLGFAGVGDLCFIGHAHGEEPSEFASSETGDRVVRLFYGTGGGMVCQRYSHVDWVQDKDSHLMGISNGSTLVVEANGAGIAGATEICDINSAAGSDLFVLYKAGNQTRVYACKDGHAASVGLDGGVSDIVSGVVGRRISNKMMVPLGGKIWQGNLERWAKGKLSGRTWTTREICGEPDGWSNIGVDVVSPDNNLLLGTAMKTKDADGEPLDNPVIHSVLLVPIEFVTKGKSGEFLRQSFTYNSVSAPVVAVSAANASVNANGTVNVQISGMVTDDTSDCTPTPGRQINQLTVSGGGFSQTLGLSNSDSPQSNNPWRPYAFKAYFSHAFTLPSDVLGTIPILLETNANAGGVPGTAEVTVDIGGGNSNSMLKLKLLNPPSAFNSMAIDSLDCVYDNLAMTLMETGVNDKIFTVTTADFTISIDLNNYSGIPANLDEFIASVQLSTATYMQAHEVQFRRDGQTNNFIGYFPARPGTPATKTAAAYVSGSNGPGNFFPTIVRFPVGYPLYESFDFRVNIMEHDWKVKKLSYRGEKEYWYVVDDHDKPVVFNPSAYANTDIQTKPLQDKFSVQLKKSGGTLGLAEFKVTNGLLVFNGDVSSDLGSIGNWEKIECSLAGDKYYNYKPKEGKELTHADNSIRTEIIWRYVGTKDTVFRFDSVEQFRRDILFREKVVQNVSRANFRFGYPLVNSEYWRYDNEQWKVEVGKTAWEAIADVFNNPDLYCMACFDAMKMVFLNAASQVLSQAYFETLVWRIPLGNFEKIQYKSHAISSADWIPGDAGGIGFKSIDNSEPPGNLEEGFQWAENIIYLGGCFEKNETLFMNQARFWGHNPYVKIRSLGDFMDYVSKWNTTGNGRAELGKTRSTLKQYI